MIKGNLSSFSLGEIFQSLAVNNHTGTLKIVEKDGTEKYIYFSRGEICLFSIKSYPTLRIGEILVRQGKISRQDLEQSLRDQQTTSEKLGQILIKNYGLSQEDIQQALETKIYDEIYDLFLLSDAEFEFFVDHFPEEIFETFPENVRISINATAVVMEGLRVADEWKLIQKKIRTFNEIFALTPAAGDTDFESPLDAALHGLVDGETPLRKLFSSFPGSRFDCCKTTFGFLGAGLLRPLTIDECREKGVRARKEGDLEKAFDFLKYAAELSPDRPEPQVLIGSLLEKMGRAVEARLHFLSAVKLYAASGVTKQVIKVGEPLLEHHGRDEGLLKRLFEAALQENDTRLVELCGDAYADLLAGRGLKKNAAEILGQTCNLAPRNLERKVRAAGLFRESGCKREAVALLEEVADGLTAKTRMGERVKVLRTIYEIAPERQDIKQEISNLLDLQARLEHRKKRRFTIAGIMSICLLLLLLVPLLYEIKARELMSHAQKLEAISQTSGNYSFVKSTYQELLNSYPMSTQARIARDALERIATIERMRARELQQEKRTIENAQAEKLEEMKVTITRLFELANEREQAGDYRSAFEVLKKISKDFPELPKTKLIPLPITITSFPPGCDVTINEKEVGSTPLVIRERDGVELIIHLSRTGCESLQKVVTVGASWNIHFDLNLRPLDQFHVSGAIHCQVDAYGTELYFVSRDGFLYCMTPTDQSTVWRRQVGMFGDLTSSPLYTPTEVILGDVMGDVSTFSRSNGESRWRTTLKGTILATPTVSADGGWVAVGDLNGNVFLLDNQNGKPKAAFRAENEIIHALSFWRDAVLVPSQDNTLYVLGVPDLRPVGTYSFPRDFASGPVVEGDVAVLTTEGGNVHCLDLAAGTSLWSTHAAAAIVNTPRVASGDVYVGTDDGRVIALNAQTGEVRWQRSIVSSAPGEFLIHRGALYCGSGEGELIGFSLRARQRRWLFRFEDSVQEAPVAIGNRLHFVSTSGKFVVMEAFEE